MRALILAIACVLSTSAFARGSKPHPAPPPPLEQPRPPVGDWEWVPTDGTDPGVWVTHPPIEFAIDAMGVEAVQRCALALEKGTAACAVQLATCQRLVLPNTGKLRLELDASCLAREAKGVRLQLQSDTDAT